MNLLSATSSLLLSALRMSSSTPPRARRTRMLSRYVMCTLRHFFRSVNSPCGYDDRKRTSSSVSPSPTGENLTICYSGITWLRQGMPFAIAAYYGCFCTLHFIFMTLSMFTHMTAMATFFLALNLRPLGVGGGDGTAKIVPSFSGLCTALL